MAGHVKRDCPNKPRDGAPQTGQANRNQSGNKSGAPQAVRTLRYEAPEFVPSPPPGMNATSMADVELEGIGIGPEEVAEALEGVAELEAQELAELAAMVEQGLQRERVGCEWI